MIKLTILPPNVDKTLPMNHTDSKSRTKSQQIRQFIITEVEDSPKDIAKLTAEQFDISRQAVHRHLRRLLEEKILVASGATRGTEYELRNLVEWEKSYLLFEPLAESKHLLAESKHPLEENDVWDGDIHPRLKHLPKNVIDIWHCCFTEMFNNALEHSKGDRIWVNFAENAATATISIHDDGVGIFKKIQTTMQLSDERHASIELAKGKFTTDPDNHSGEGIFFTSRMLNEFQILSGSILFAHFHGEESAWVEEFKTPRPGTAVMMKLDNTTDRTSEQVFTQFASADSDYTFNKTIIPIHLALYGDDALVSRSQAKRVLVRLERFDTVIFDFKKVERIGQAFADEIFRVFAKRHPQIHLSAINHNEAVERMIRRAQTHK